MSEIISSTALIYAILSINSEIALQKDYLNSPEIEESEIKNEMDILDDMEQAFYEFIEHYKKRCKTEMQLPDITELLNSTI